MLKFKDARKDLEIIRSLLKEIESPTVSYTDDIKKMQEEALKKIKVNANQASNLLSEILDSEYVD